MHRPRAPSKRLGIDDRGGDIRLGQEHGFRQPPAQRQMASDSCGKCASSSVSGIRTLALGLEDLLFHPALGRKAQKIGRLLEVASGHDYCCRPLRVQLQGGGLHLLWIGHGNPGKR